MRLDEIVNMKMTVHMRQQELYTAYRGKLLLPLVILICAMIDDATPVFTRGASRPSKSFTTSRLRVGSNHINLTVTRHIIVSTLSHISLGA